jgi:hypothetical protein
MKVGQGGKVVVKQPNSTGQKGYGWRTMLSKYWEIGGPCRGRTYGPLIKSPAETLPQDAQQEEPSAKGEDL